MVDFCAEQNDGFFHFTPKPYCQYKNMKSNEVTHILFALSCTTIPQRVIAMKEIMQHLKVVFWIIFSLGFIKKIHSFA
jgi:hypothetical protein